MAAFCQVVEAFQDGVPLFVETDLKNLSLDSILLKRLNAEFKWHFRDTQRSFLTKMERPLTRYEFSYYSRMHDHFGFDQTVKVRENMNNVVCNWDPKVDFDNHPRPCFLTLKLIPEKEFLNVSVTFRTRDVLKRMVPNWIAIKVFMEEECKVAGKKMGKLFDYSNQVMAKKEDLAKVKSWDEYKELMVASK
jgi:thymidylate synthase